MLHNQRSLNLHVFGCFDECSRYQALVVTIEQRNFVQFLCIMNVMYHLTLKIQA